MTRCGFTMTNEAARWFPGNIARLGIPMLLCAAWTGTSMAQSSLPELTPIVAAVHVHTTASTGTWNLEQVVQEAERLDLDAVILSENLVLRYQYGLPPFRNLLRQTVRIPSLVDYGVDRYLREVAEVQARHPKVILVPGIEVAPHYYWTGSLITGTLTMHNAQRNLLVVGMGRAEDYLSLPVLGNETSYRRRTISLVELIPVALFIPAGLIWWPFKRALTATLGRASTSAVLRKLALALFGFGLLFLIDRWSSGQPMFGPYEAAAGYRPYQVLIDAVQKRGGEAVWSMVEARDFHTYRYGPLGPVTIKTEPHPDALVQTHRYAAFGGLYHDNRQVAVPGGVWDRLLDQHHGSQKPFPTLIGEIAFHGPEHSRKELDQVLTVFSVTERSAAGILDALRNGRAYAVLSSQKDYRLMLDKFQVMHADNPGRDFENSSDRGSASRPRDVSIEISASDHGQHPVTVTIVRSGDVLARLSGVTPFRHILHDTDESERETISYRLHATGNGELLSNPLVVRQ